MTQPLPYHCPTLKGNFFKPPCARQIESAEERLAESPNAMLGFLGKCLECGGKDLVKREDVAMEYTGDIRPEDVTREPATVREDRIVQEEQSMKAAVKFKTQEEAELALGPGKVPPAANSGPPAIATLERGQFCKNCSGVESHRNKHGGYMGLCRACLAQRAVENSRDRGKKTIKEKMTTAAPRDLATYPLSDETHLCTRPDCEAPGSPVKIDKLSRSMGMCAACVSARGRKSGAENARSGKTSPPVSIPLNQAEYAELREWLEGCAKYYEQTLQKAIIFQLKRAMRMGADHA